MNDVGIGPAAAEIAVEAFANFFFRRLGLAIQKGPHADDETRRAKAALLGVALDECLGHGVIGQALDGGDLLADACMASIVLACIGLPSTRTVAAPLEPSVQTGLAPVRSS